MAAAVTPCTDLDDVFREALEQVEGNPTGEGIDTAALRELHAKRLVGLALFNCEQRWALTAKGVATLRWES